MKYDAKKISEMTETNLRLAKMRLAELPICCGREPSIAGLHGWVFEQTLQFCIREELAEHGLSPDVEEQVGIGGRAKADFRLAHVLIEVKTRGLFGMADVQKYGKYREQAEGRGYRYLFVTASETHEPYRRGIIEALGQSNVFILAQPGEWERLVTTIVQELKAKTGYCP